MDEKPRTLLGDAFDLELEEDAFEPAPPPPTLRPQPTRRRRPLFGLAARQRALLAAFLFFDALILGFLILYAFKAIQL